MAEWDLRKLRILRALDERGTVTATAEALHMTPSAVSQQLTNLARQLGVPLLQPQGRRVRLTDAARLVLRHADAVFEELERADAGLSAHLRGEAGEVRIGAFSTAVPALVVPAVRTLRDRHPAVTVRVREAEARQAYELLAAGEVDLALSLAAHAPGAGEAGFTRVPLLADPLDLALPPDHPLASAPRLRLADLAQEEWIFGGSGPWSDITRAACEAAGFSPHQGHSAAGWTAILAMVEAGMGVALVPRMAALPGTDVVMRALTEDRPRRHVVAAVRKGAREAPALRRVLAALHTAATALTGHETASAAPSTAAGGTEAAGSAGETRAAGGAGTARAARVRPSGPGTPRGAR